MKRSLVSTSSFERAYHKFTSRDAQLQGLWAYSCGYDCRIVFSIEEDEEQGEIVLLIDIETHDDVY